MVAASADALTVIAALVVVASVYVGIPQLYSPAERACFARFGTATNAERIGMSEACRHEGLDIPGFIHRIFH